MRDKTWALFLYILTYVPSPICYCIILPNKQFYAHASIFSSLLCKVSMCTHAADVTGKGRKALPSGPAGPSR